MDDRQAEPEAGPGAHAFGVEALKRCEQPGAKCMREHGLTNFPDPDPAGSPINVDPIDPRFNAADEACASVRPGARRDGTAGASG